MVQGVGDKFRRGEEVPPVFKMSSSKAFDSLESIACAAEDTNATTHRTPRRKPTLLIGAVRRERPERGCKEE